MHTPFRLIIAAVAITASAISWADSDRPAHAKGEPAETLQQAVSNLREYNDKLEKLVAKDELSAQELHEVHMITYTLENALQKIQADLEETAEVLEEVHLASESNKPGVVRERGQVYLENTRALAR